MTSMTRSGSGDCGGCGRCGRCDGRWQPAAAAATRPDLHPTAQQSRAAVRWDRPAKSRSRRRVCPQHEHRLERHQPPLVPAPADLAVRSVPEQPAWTPIHLHGCGGERRELVSENGPAGVVNARSGSDGLTNDRQGAVLTSLRDEQLAADEVPRLRPAFDAPRAASGTHGATPTATAPTISSAAAAAAASSPSAVATAAPATRHPGTRATTPDPASVSAPARPTHLSPPPYGKLCRSNAGSPSTRPGRFLGSLPKI